MSCLSCPNIFLDSAAQDEKWDQALTCDLCRKIKQHVIPTTPSQNTSLFGGEFYKRGQVKGWFKRPAAALFFFILNVEPLQLAIRHLTSSVSLYRERWGETPLGLSGTKSSFRETTGQETPSTKSTNKKNRSQDRCNLRFSSPDLFDFPSPVHQHRSFFDLSLFPLSVLILFLPSLLSLLSLQISAHICGCKYVCHLQWPVSVSLLYVRGLKASSWCGQYGSQPASNRSPE